MGFSINWNKSALTPVQEIKLFEPKITSVTLEVSLREKIRHRVKTKRQNLQTKPKTLILELKKVISLLASTT